MSLIAAIPKIDINVDGKRLEPFVRDALVSLRVQQKLSVPTQAELVFNLPVSAMNSGLTIASGNDFEISVGSDKLFTGQVTGIEYEYGSSGEKTVRIRGYDRLHQLRKIQSVTSYADKSLEHLARELATRVGLQFSSSTYGAKWPYRIQFQQSEFELLADAAEFCGQYFFVRDNKLQLITLEGTGESVSLILGKDLFEARIELNAESTCDSVTVMGWDPSRVELHKSSARQARVGRAVNVSAKVKSVGGSGKRIVTGCTLDDDTQAGQLAQGELDRRVASEVTVSGVADGNSRLCPGNSVNIRGVDPNQEGHHVLTAVVHSIDDRKGFVSEFSTVPPPPRQPRPHGTVATWGVVKNIDDPDRLGRVKVNLPTYDGLESDWMGVVTPGGGKGKGFIAMPDCGDDVLVIFANKDPAQGIVVGGLYGSQKPPDHGGIKGNSVRRYSLMTPGGQIVRLDDDNDSVRLESSCGSYVELTPQRARVHSTADLTLEAPGKSVFVRGKSIRFEEA